MKIDLVVFYKDEPHILIKHFESFRGLEMYLEIIKNKGYSLDLKLSLDKPVMKEK